MQQPSSTSQQNISGNLQGRPSHSHEEDFSVISSPESSQFLSDETEWPDSLLYQSGSVPLTSPISGDYKCTNENILSSHYALATAYEKLKRKFTESERENDVLKKQLKPTMSTGTGGSITSLNQNSDEITRAWEAYREKCRECEQIRDELKDTQQKLQTSESKTRIQSLHEEVHREKARYNDLQQELTSCRGSMEHIGQKEMLAREALLKEKEYQANLLAATEKKHKEMQSEIEDMKAQLLDEQEQRNAIMRAHKDEMLRQQEIYAASQNQFKISIRHLEERNIQLQESLSESHQQADEMSLKVNDYYSSGSSGGGGLASDEEVLEILGEVKSLTEEIQQLREVSRNQKRLLAALVATPAIENILKQLSIGNKPPQDKVAGNANMESSMNSVESNSSSVEQYHTPPMSFNLPTPSLCLPKTSHSSLMTNDPPPVIKTTDEFIRDLHKGNKSPYSQSKTKSHFSYQSSPAVSISRVIHDHGGGSNSRPNDMLDLNNVPNTYHNERGTLNIRHEDNDDLQPTSIMSDDGNESSMLTLQAAKGDEMCISSDEDNQSPSHSQAPTTSHQNILRPDIRAKPPVPAKPNIIPQNKPITQPTGDVVALNQTCPVCNYKFMPGATERAMGRHINSHFSDDEDGDFLQIGMP